jgi:hypothetical protein
LSVERHAEKHPQAQLKPNLHLLNPEKTKSSFCNTKQIKKVEDFNHPRNPPCRGAKPITDVCHHTEQLSAAVTVALQEGTLYAASRSRLQEQVLKAQKQTTAPTGKQLIATRHPCQPLAGSYGGRLC